MPKINSCGLPWIDLERPLCALLHYTHVLWESFIMVAENTTKHTVREQWKRRKKKNLNYDCWVGLCAIVTPLAIMSWCNADLVTDRIDSELAAVNVIIISCYCRRRSRMRCWKVRNRRWKTWRRLTSSHWTHGRRLLDLASRSVPDLTHLPYLTSPDLTLNDIVKAILFLLAAFAAIMMLFVVGCATILCRF